MLSVTNLLKLLSISITAAGTIMTSVYASELNDSDNTTVPTTKESAYYMESSVSFETESEKITAEETLEDYHEIFTEPSLFEDTVADMITEKEEENITDIVIETLPEQMTEKETFFEETNTEIIKTNVPTVNDSTDAAKNVDEAIQNETIPETKAETEKESETETETDPKIETIPTIPMFSEESTLGVIKPILSQPVTEPITNETIVSSEAVETTESETVTETLPQYTNIVYKTLGKELHFDTMEQAKSELSNIERLSDDEVKQNVKENKIKYGDLVNEIVEMINAHRIANGLSALTVSDTLMNASMHRAVESAYAKWGMTAYLDGSKKHIRPNFERASSIMQEYNITGAFGEVYGRYQKTPLDIVNAWKNSSSHNATLLRGYFTQIGIGVAQDSNGYYYWFAEFN